MDSDHAIHLHPNHRCGMHILKIGVPTMFQKEGALFVLPSGPFRETQIAIHFAVSLCPRSTMVLGFIP